MFTFLQNHCSRSPRKGVHVAPEYAQLRKVEPKVFDLMTHFARNPGKVFSRDDLIKAVWPGRVVSDATVSTCIKSARKALGDSGDSQRYITTVRGRGFRFTADVAHDSSETNSSTHTLDRSQRTGVGPSLLVVPFRSLSDDADTALLADSLSRDVGTILHPDTVIAFEQPVSQVYRPRHHAKCP